MRKKQCLCDWSVEFRSFAAPTGHNEDFSEDRLEELGSLLYSGAICFYFSPDGVPLSDSELEFGVSFSLQWLFGVLFRHLFM